MTTPDAFIEVDYSDCHDDIKDNARCTYEQFQNIGSLLLSIDAIGHRPLADKGYRIFHAFMSATFDTFLSVMKDECEKHGIRLEVSES